MSRLFISPKDQRDYERRAYEWGERGPAHNINFVVEIDTRTTIIENAKGNVALNSMERQKQRTFT